ncbi:hypothetical protein SCT_2411 [Sulfuricella sp. T08]|uniref:hypothetical protein n=1 Tax=Sulfuricella sp. T08 TaxID=1632857 RepID=UPI000617989B|nr:hypothetical protein [Sulfuricella sp. T08]GAO36996.1 hypothetical protein SCT_2411 [Sulfuricella sp. T08]
MTTKEHPNGKMAEQNLPQGASSPAQSVDESRRRFGKSGLAASGVILTLASQPVLGNWACQSPSGFQSGNASPHGLPPQCMGRTPGYWQAPNKNWPSPYTTGTCTNKDFPSSNNPLDWKGGTYFKDIFNCGGNGTRYRSACLPSKNGCTQTTPLSLMQVLLLGGSLDPYQLGAHIVAALLNAQMGWTPVLTVPAVKNMFNEWAAKGYYEPNAGVKWSAADIVTYLQTTMTL